MRVDLCDGLGLAAELGGSLFFDPSESDMAEPVSLAAVVLVASHDGDLENDVWEFVAGLTTAF